MKNLLKTTITLLLTILALSCNLEENLDSLENQSLHYEDFFKKVSNMKLKTSEENVIYINYKWDATKETIEYLNSKEKEPDFFILELESEDNIASRIEEGGYQVDCDRGGDGSNNWSKTCNGKWSCAKLIAKCLNEGGCATICQQQMIYIPQTNTFYLNVVE
ncbi:hypothetical protein F7018_12615 [Tenacibaculum aiptasiae]|uniref:Lipoprotein n=1 Tax=Tenacibaculum aiptasiae TaxID=426481 RepID=A0A7J5ACR9_9FLAO|nr:hypothetical protein [Tenacibaculum aiptasiae]KAB1155310.1 hypothetical protein F7018_12615 [Tenacibaculum aiptasiae]